MGYNAHSDLVDGRARDPPILYIPYIHTAYINNIMGYNAYTYLVDGRARDLAVEEQVGVLVDQEAQAGEHGHAAVLELRLGMYRYACR